MERKFIIYDHISPSGKHYIGQTCKRPTIRWGANGVNYLKKSNGKYVHRLFANAINKYGWDKFQHNILFENLSELDANMIEEDIIWYYKSINKSYNLTNGGDGYKGLHHSEETKMRLSENHKGLKWSEDRKRAFSKARTGIPSKLKGTTLSEETKQKMSQSRKGLKRSPEAILNIVNGRKKPINQLSLTGELIRKWDSQTEAAKELGISQGNINSCLTGRRSTANGFIWKYDG